MSGVVPQPPALPPRWMPIGDEPDLCSTGQWWDAVRAYEAEGQRAIEALRAAGERLGPVILDPGGLEPRLYFLVPPRSLVGWEEPRTVPLGRTCHVVVPPARKTTPPGLHWHHLPELSHTLTQVEPLRVALRKARGEHQATKGPC